MNNTQHKVQAFFFGFSPWKHRFIKPFISKDIEVNFINPLLQNKYLKKALKKGLNSQSHVYIWGKKEFSEVETFVKKEKIPLFRIEDGFIRSVGLGSDLTQPYSLVMDAKGIYFDASCESELENILNFHQFSEDELKRAKTLRHYLIEKKLSKYNNFDERILNFPQDKKIVLIPGQVEDDASIKYGANGMTNLELLQQVRRNEPEAHLVYKPHPDVLVGNRRGHIDEKNALVFCDEVVSVVSLDSVLSLCDEVHTMTSLVGFEALMRGIKVVTYGLPFYAGWGLSEDSRECKRRIKILSIDELSAATLLLYPVYINPKSLEICEIEEMLEGLELEKQRLESSPLYKRSQKIRNYTSRKTQMLLRLVK